MLKTQVWTGMLFGLIFAFHSPVHTASEKVFCILVQRERTGGNLVTGKLSVNGKVLGVCYENLARKIPPGVYTAHLRYESGKNHVTGPGGSLGKKGDFLIELDPFKANGREVKYIQFHAGNQAEHSDGCILCGPATKDGKTGASLAPPVLREMRLMFYGNDRPNGTPNKKIVVEIREP